MPDTCTDRWQEQVAQVLVVVVASAVSVVVLFLVSGVMVGVSVVGVSVVASA
jgi:hypothetical protein